jgi:hypothetical protein
LLSGSRALRFTATGVPLAARRIRILPMNIYTHTHTHTHIYIYREREREGERERFYVVLPGLSRKMSPYSFG